MHGLETAFDISALAGASGVLVPGGEFAVQQIRGFSLGSFGGTTRLRVREENASGKILLTLQVLDGQTVGAENTHLRCDGDVYVQFVAGAANLEGSIWVA